MDFNNFEILQIGTLIANNPLALSISIISSETNLAWHVVVLKKPTSDQLINRLPSINSKDEMESFIKELNNSGEKYFLLQETVPCWGDEEELVNYIADNLLLDWQNFSSLLKQNPDYSPQILVFSNKAEITPSIREITPIIFDGQAVECITVAPQDE